MYKIQKILRRGLGHKNFCEDSLYVRKYNNYIAAGVFDGCSSGVDSYFASALLSRSCRFICDSELTSKIQTCSFDELFATILYKFINKFFDLCHRLLLYDDEMLSTIIFLLLDTKEQTGRVISIGDGFLHINGEAIEIDQNNMPAYITYSKNSMATREKFDNWLNVQENIFDIDKMNDITISTDGILSFVDVKDIHSIAKDEAEYVTKNVKKDSGFAVRFLAEDTTLINNSAMFGRKCNILKNRYRLVNYDDLGIVRIISQNQPHA